MADTGAPWFIKYRGNAELGQPINEITEEIATSVHTALNGISGGVSQLSSLGINNSRTTTSNVFTATNAAGDSAFIVYPRPASNRLNIRIHAQLGVSAGQGIVGFETRDTDASGTVRNAAGDADAIIMGSSVAGNNTHLIDMDITVPGTSTDIFVRPMWRVSSGGATMTISRLKLYVKAIP